MKTQMRMMLICFFGIANIVTSQCQQSWFGENSKWVYNFTTPTTEGVVILEYLSEDTVINNLEFNKIQHRGIYHSYPNVGQLDTITHETKYLRQEGNNILQYDNGIDTVYNFDNSVGDTLSYMNFGGYNDYDFILDSIGELEINDQILKFQDIKIVNQRDSTELLWMRVVERIGSISTFFLPQYTVIQPFDLGIWSFICYSDNLVQVSGKNVFGLDCDSIPSYTGNENNSRARIEVFPNPAIDILNIVNDDLNIRMIKIFSLHGKELKSVTQNLSNQIQIDLKGISERGVLILICYGSNNRIEFIGKIVRTRV